jgi:protein ImuB
MTRILVLDIPGWSEGFDTEADAHRQFDDVIRLVEDTVPLVRVISAGRIAMNARGPARYYGSETAAATALRAAHPAARIVFADGL